MNKNYKPILFIVLAGILWGTSGIFVKLLLPYGYTSLQMTGVRAAVSFFAVALFALIRDRSLFRVRPVHLLIFMAVGASLFITASSYYQAMQRTSTGVAVVLMYMAPIYVSIWSVLFFGERMTRAKAVAIGLMLLGCVFVSGIFGGTSFDLIGLLLGILSGISYAAYSILTKLSIRLGATPLSVTLYAFLTMLTIGIFASDPIGTVDLAAKAPVSIPLLLGLGLCTFVLPYVLYTLALKELSAGTAAALSIVEPMAATVFGVTLLEEKLSPIALIGIFMIILAVFLVGRAEKG